MIDFEQKFIFIHITKTGGTSVETALGGKLHDHRACKKYIEEYGDDIFDRLPSFTIVRNPWDKMVSHYAYLRLHKKANEKNKVPWSSKVKDLSFDQWLEKIANGEQVTAFPLRHFNYIKVNGKIVVKHIIRFENLQEDFNKACSKIGIEATKLPHLNKSNHAHYSCYYNEKTKNIIGKHYKEEIDYFGYKFGKI